MRGTGVFSVVLCLVIFPRFLSGNSDPRLAPALYVLGDSLLDSGNNNFLPTLARADFKPYGVNFPGGATGRFTNGRTVADFIGMSRSPKSVISVFVFCCLTLEICLMNNLRNLYLQEVVFEDNNFVAKLKTQKDAFGLYTIFIFGTTEREREIEMVMQI